MPTALWYGPSVSGQFGATAADRVDWTTDTLKVALVTSAYTPNQDTHQYWSSASASELAAGNGYTTGGVTLGTKTRTYDTATNTVRLDCADPSWTFTTSKTFRYALVYKDTGVAGTSQMLAYLDFGADQNINGVFTIVVDATDGLLRLVVS